MTKKKEIENTIVYNGISVVKEFTARWVTLYDTNGDVVYSPSPMERWNGDDIEVNGWHDLVSLAEKEGVLEDDTVRSIEFQTYETDEEGDIVHGTLNDYVIDWVEGMPRLMRVLG